MFTLHPDRPARLLAFALALTLPLTFTACDSGDDSDSGDLAGTWFSDAGSAFGFEAYIRITSDGDDYDVESRDYNLNEECFFDTESGRLEALGGDRYRLVGGDLADDEATITRSSNRLTIDYDDDELPTIVYEQSDRSSFTPECDDDPDPPIPGGSVSFRVDGVTYSYDDLALLNGYFYDPLTMVDVLLLFGPPTGQRRLNVRGIGLSEVGTYEFNGLGDPDTTGVLGGWQEEASLFSSGQTPGVPGELVITQLTATRITGMFSFVATDESGETRSITDGRFDMEIFKN